MANKPLMESYKNRIQKADALYTKAHLNESMSYTAKTTMAVVLDNLSKKITGSSINESLATQRADLGDYKKFCLTVTNIVFPQLLIEDLVLVQPMSSYSGVVSYAKYTFGTSKGGVKEGDFMADPWSIQKVDEYSVNYTGAPVVEPIDAEAEEFVPAWTPVVGNKVIAIEKEGGKEYEFALVDGKLPITAGRFSKIKYAYDNEKIPAIDVPTINVEMASLPLVAKARRIAIRFSQLALFQASTDYNFDAKKQLVEKACARLEWEINEEVIRFVAAIGDKNVCSEAKFDLKLPVGVNKKDHFESFQDNLQTAKNYIYDATGRFMPTVFMCNVSSLRVLKFVPGFVPANTSKAVGSFIAGTLDGMKVIVSQSVKAGKNYLVVKGNDFETACAVYGAYMPIMPTQLLETADGYNSQGFATMYALEKLNDHLVCEFDIVDTTND